MAYLRLSALVRSGAHDRTAEDERRDYARLMEHLKKQARAHELCRLFSDQFVDDVASQRAHAGLMLG